MSTATKTILAAIAAMPLLAAVPAHAKGPPGDLTRHLDVQTRDAHYLPQCPDAKRGMAGVCILASVAPKTSSGLFDVYTQEGRFVDDVYVNSVREIPPGDYIAYHVDAHYPQYAVSFKVEPGKVTNLVTATLSLRVDEVADLQGGNDYINGAGACVDPDVYIDMYGKGNAALMPGAYILDFGGPDCTSNEIAIELEEGKATVVKIKR